MASETEGFICPYCLIGFASGGKLQAHFVDLHSEEATEPEPPLGEEEGWEDEEVRNGPSAPAVSAWSTVTESLDRHHSCPEHRHRPQSSLRLQYMTYDTSQ